MDRPDSDFLDTFAGLEKALLDLPGVGAYLPPAAAPDPGVLTAWLAPYHGWALSDLYLEYIKRYGGVATKVPPVGVGLHPLEQLLEYRTKREAIGEVFKTRIVPISPSNIDGELCLVFDHDDAPPRVGFFHDDGDVDFVANSFAHHLWNSLFFLCLIHEVRFSEYISFPGVPADDIDGFNLRLGAELPKAGFEVWAADSRVLSGRRDDTYVSVTVRGPNIGVSLGNARSHNELARAHAEMDTILAACR